MNLIRPALVVLLLGAWAASLAPSDARPRGAKQMNPGRHAGVTAPVAGAVKARGTTPPVIRAAPALTKRNSIGAVTPPAGIGPPKAGVATIPGPNAAGLTKPSPVVGQPGTIAMPPAPAGVARIGPGAGPTMFVRSAAPPLTVHGPGISGTGMARPGAAPGVVGGPAKLAGGITGTGMKPKR
jgi:hypothetical protein